ncbi:hypothetical protein F993_03790 [Acinetobacter proteolyticus]|uniref:Pilus assembly protein PilE n=1 Tax=Acinetobacter proteolyticus TaxID=1776741 RepID=A0ABN0J9N1_9GAMM|nr:hypothetical protein F993_03790 [Acinetobacter proteolyticus]
MRNIRNGFTLIELMIVVAIIGIIAAVAYPSYLQYGQRAKRADVQAEMINIAQIMQARKLAYNSYLNTDTSKNTITAIYGSSVSPKQGTPLYDLAFNTLTASTWVLTAIPKTGTPQAGNGVICLNDQGQKDWSKSSSTAAACIARLSNISTWDGR